MTPEQAKGLDGTCETMKVKSGDGFVIINKADFKADEHEPYVEPGEQSEDGGKKKRK